MQRIIIAGCVLLALGGCASGPPFIDQIQPEAVNMAVRRGQFELNCAAATGEMISRETLEATYVVICPDNGSMSCFAGGGRTVVR